MSPDPFADVRSATRRHQAAHGCGAYVYGNPTLLGVVTALTRARRIVEVGTALGYSALRDLLREEGILIAGNMTMARPGLADRLDDDALWLSHSLGETALAVKRGAGAGG
jgi:hypothetical protein